MLADLPQGLGLPDDDPTSADWAQRLDEPTTIDSTPKRELLLRYLLTRAIVDQGSDVHGVEMWHRALLEDCYAAGIYLLHRPEDFVARYADVIRIADGRRQWVVAERSELWANQSARRSAGSYTPFNVDGMRGGKQAHWFVSARFFPALLLARARPGGLSQLVFEDGPADESPLGMARRLRQDPLVGLGWCLGDKAADLFAKWAIGTLRLTPPTQRPWTAMDTSIPMDQRIGRVLMRCGVMDEFFDIPKLLRTKQGMLANLENIELPEGDAIPAGSFFLTVRDFRRYARASRPSAVEWLGRKKHGRGWLPQEVISELCRSLSAATGKEFTPVHLDDFFMEVADKWCWDQAPQCSTCPLSTSCQANNDPTRASLKFFIT